MAKATAKAKAKTAIAKPAAKPATKAKTKPKTKAKPKSKKPVRYQLVVQFAQDWFAAHDAVWAYEELLAQVLPAKTCDVDGYDVGSGTVNFFVYTTHPEAAFKTVLYRTTTRAMQRRIRIAYRPDTDDGAFTNRWPRRDSRPFAYIYEAGDDPFAPAAKRRIPKRSPHGTRAP